MDGTRIIRTIELYENEYLVGDSFPANVRSFPEPHKLPKLESQEQVQEYVLSVRTKGKYSAEAHSLDLVDTTSKSQDITFGSFLEAQLVLMPLIYIWYRSIITSLLHASPRMAPRAVHVESAKSYRGKLRFHVTGRGFST